MRLLEGQGIAAVSLCIGLIIGLVNLSPIEFALQHGYHWDR